MNVSFLPMVYLILGAAALALANVHRVTSGRVSSTDGHEAVVWDVDNAQMISRSKRNTNEGLSVRCRIARASSIDELTSRQMVRRSADEFEADKQLCVTHEVQRRQIMAGTKWCGNGDVSKHYDDLGYFSNIDKCCRAHDHCDKFVAGDDTAYGVTNNTPYTWSDCVCDDDFRTCLHKVNSFMANVVGKMFYSLVPDSKCLEFDKKDSKKAKAVSKGTYEGRGKEEEGNSWLSWFG